MGSSVNLSDMVNVQCLMCKLNVKYSAEQYVVIRLNVDLLLFLESPDCFCS